MASVGEFVSKHFDFVICGGGTAGLVLAARLSENPDVSVLVLEAGENLLDDMMVDTPAMFSQMYNKPRYDWIYKTVPQEGNLNREHHIIRGKALGGSSTVNFMMHVDMLSICPAKLYALTPRRFARGSKEDYDDWAELVGDVSWSFNGMKDYFLKAETFNAPLDSRADLENYTFESAKHGTKGPIHTSFNTSPNFGVEAAVMTAADTAIGFTKRPDDAWSGDHIGFFNNLGTIFRTGPHRGKRSYAARGYYEDVKRPNLQVLCEALVTKVTLSEGNVATGVEFTHGDTTFSASAGREVIVCGGSINSPQLLELSGIGDPEVLKAAGVECKAENKGVGNNYQDHFMTASGAFLKPDAGYTADILNVPDVMEGAMKALQEEGDGPLTCISTMQGFYPYKKIASPQELQSTIQKIRDDPTTSEFQRRQHDQIIRHLGSDTSANLQLILMPVKADFTDLGILDQSKLFGGKLGDPMAFAVPTLLGYPVARGYVHIKSSDPTAYPAINPRYFSHPADRAVLSAAVRFTDKVFNTEPLKSMISERIYPSPELDLQDLAQAEKAAEGWIMNAYHPIGSCSMGEVVDTRLRVKGVRNLRVCDASVFPNHCSGNIVATVYAVAEKGADIIKADHGI